MAFGGIEVDTKTIATIGAILERDFDDYAIENGVNIEQKTYQVTVDGIEQTIKLKCIDQCVIEGVDGANMTKCLAFKDQYGNIYFHFRGTGDGYWEYNAPAAYSANESRVQLESKEFFERVIEAQQADGKTIHDVYVTGHSQGGNTAQYVTIASKYSDYIKVCVSLDGPGFTDELLKKIKEQYGEAYYERQRQKIFAYNGCSDYVSPLGEIHIIPDGHTVYIKTRKDDSGAFFCNHCADYLLMKDRNELNEEGVESEFRKFIVEIAEKLAELPADDQERIAILVMKICENYLQKDKVTQFNDDDMQTLQELVVPFLVSILAEYPDRFEIIFNELEQEPEIVALLNDFIREFNDMPEKERKDVLRLLASCLTVENGNLASDDDWASIVAIVVALLPALQNTAINNPKELMKLLEESKIFDKLEKAAMKNPGITIRIVLEAARHFDIILGIGLGVEGAALLVEKFYGFIEKLDNLTDRIKTFVVNCVNGIRKTYTDFCTYLRNISAGAGYTERYPYIKADTGRLYEYANRISNINRRLTNLNGDLSSLYLQVGFLDIWDILVADLITGYSPRLLLVQNYLKDTASDLEAADRDALRYLGG